MAAGRNGRSGLSLIEHKRHGVHACKNRGRARMSGRAATGSVVKSTLLHAHSVMEVGKMDRGGGMEVWASSALTCKRTREPLSHFTAKCGLFSVEKDDSGV